MDMARMKLMRKAALAAAGLATALGPWLGVGTGAHAQAVPSIFGATLAEPGQKTAEVSTVELRQLLADGHATVFDARPFKEFALSHIPGALNVAPKPGVPLSQYVSDVAEIGRVLRGNKGTPIVLYCNGPFCGKSKRLATELLAAGFTDVRRYQLGIPVWRALGGVTEIQLDGAVHVHEADRTAIFLDARDPAEFASGTLRRARNLPASGLKPGKDAGEVALAKNDGRLPMEDHNTRIIVAGKNGGQARAVAEAIVGEAFHNVAFFGGSIDTLKTAVR